MPSSRGPAGHGLVYLLSTPWGGMALAALSANPVMVPSRARLLPLPDLTSDFVSDLIQAELSDLERRDRRIWPCPGGTRI